MMSRLNNLLADWGVYWGPLRLLDYVTTRVVLAALTAFILMLVAMPPLIRWLKRKKFGESGAKGDGAVVVDAMREGKKGTPTMGGLGLVACIALTGLLWCDPLELRTWLLQFGLLSFALVGFLDDRTKIFKGAKGTPSSVKLGIQLLAAAVCGIGLYIINQHNADLLLTGADHPAGFPLDWYKKHYELQGHDISYTVRLGVHQLSFPFVPVEWAVNLGVGSVLWVVFVSVSCANGVNFTDGMDGLASGTMLIAALAFMGIAYLTSRVDSADYLKVLYISGGQDVAIYCAAIAGACLGFLWFNSAPAEVFMGDTGSQALGGVFGLIALNTKQEFLILLVGLVFVVEAASVAIQVASYRLRGGKRVFLCAPIHHHFQYKGWPESKIVLRFWIVAALGALAALATLKVR
ncbi:MAG: phospho-N-acetylmuramoyl-pentapeptide-transferase [Planctomycetes bacterium]|nr:phospho-N-acetylmuramoyl-pentapeptide-transferase [Planctomycetota bacterium]